MLPTQLGKHFWPAFTIVTGIRIDYLSPTLYVTDLLLILLVGSVIFRWVKVLKNSKGQSQKSKIQLKSKKFIIFLVFSFSLLVYNILFASRPLLSLYGFIKLCEYVFLGFYLAKTIHSKFQLQQITLLFSISAIFESVLAILQYINQGSLNGIFYFFGERTFTGATPGIANASINGALILRPYATFSHPNVLAGYLLVAIILVWSFLLKTNRLGVRIIAIFSLLVSSIALLLTYSRVAILLWVVLLFIQLFRLGFRKVKTPKLIVIFVVIAASALLFVSFLPLMHDLYFRFMQTSLTDESVVERKELLAASWTMIRQHPLVGVGLLNFIPALAPLQKPLPLNLYLQPVHNIFVLVAAETGIIGFGLFIWLLAKTLVRIRNTPRGTGQESRVKKTFFVMVLVILITGMFDHFWLTLQQGQLLFATIIGLSWAKYNV